MEYTVPPAGRLRDCIFQSVAPLVESPRHKAYALTIKHPWYWATYNTWSPNNHHVLEVPFPEEASS